MERLNYDRDIKAHVDKINNSTVSNGIKIMCRRANGQYMIYKTNGENLYMGTIKEANAFIRGIETAYNLR